MGAGAKAGETSVSVRIPVCILKHPLFSFLFRSFFRQQEDRYPVCTNVQQNGLQENIPVLPLCPLEIFNQTEMKRSLLRQTFFLLPRRCCDAK
jgi:hypothetical protein